MSDDAQKFQRLVTLLQTVFAPAPGERWLTILADHPDERRADNDAWRERRGVAEEWFRTLRAHADALPFSDVVLGAYPHVGSNNADLPATATITRSPDGAALLPAGEELAFDALLSASSVVLAFTELSATAPLKLLAPQHGFRGATLPGFSRAMLPILQLDWEAVHERVMQFKRRLDRAESVSLLLEADGRGYRSVFDLRFRGGHASGGLIRVPGLVGNLPSGEAYIVPYEGERDGEPSRTEGELPVQFGGEVVVYRLEGNRAVEVLSSGERSDAERQRLREEPAYGNMAEVGIGVLGEWGVRAMGSTLVDEKLGLHIAFGRSDHFGGITGTAAFNDPARVVHIDRVYVESVQPLVRVQEITFVYDDGAAEPIMRLGRYLV